MSEKAPTPSLLSNERVARITNWHARLLANCEKHATDETINAAGLGGIGVLLDDMADLLADRTAFRQAVADELRTLRELAVELCIHGGHIQPEEIDEIAARTLQIDLTA